MSKIVEWVTHDEQQGSGEDMMTTCCRFEAMMDPTYGHLEIYRTEIGIDLAEEQALTDTLICQVRYLAEADGPIRRHLERFDARAA